MATRIKIEPILPRGKLKLFDMSAGRRAKEDALSELGDEAQALFEKTVETWDDKPEFTVKTLKNAVSVSTSSKIYSYIDKGTSVRYATMTPDFSPKTRVRVIASARGRGGVVRVDKRHPKPGIEAREFSVIIQERMQKKFPSRMQQAMKAYVAGEAPGL